MTVVEHEDKNNNDSSSDSNTGTDSNATDSNAGTDNTGTDSKSSTSTTSNSSNNTNDNKWPMEVESAFVEALGLIVKNGTSKIKIRDRNYGRNELISMYIWYKTGKYRTKKQISSHIQVWKKSLLAKKKSSMLTNENESYVLDLIENGPQQSDESTRYFFNFFETIIATGLSSYPAFAISHRPMLVAPSVTLPLPMMSQQWYYQQAPPPPPEGYYYPPSQAVYNFNFPNVAAQPQQQPQQPQPQQPQQHPFPNGMGVSNHQPSNNNISRSESNSGTDTRSNSDGTSFSNAKLNHVINNDNNINNGKSSNDHSNVGTPNSNPNGNDNNNSNNKTNGTTNANGTPVLDNANQKQHLPYPIFPNHNSPAMTQYYNPNGYRYHTPPIYNYNMPHDKNGFPPNPGAFGYSNYQNPNNGLQQYQQYGNEGYYMQPNPQMPPSIIQNSYTNNNTTNITNNPGSLPNINSSFDMNNSNGNNRTGTPSVASSLHQTEGLKDKSILNSNKLPSFASNKELPSFSSFDKKLEPKIESNY